MHRHTKGSVSVRLPLPRELPIGAAIGVGACHVKQIQTKYGVRYQVDAKKREVVVTGPRATVDDAIDGIQDLFHRLRLERLQHRERQLQQRYLQNTGVNRAQHRVYRIAAASGTSQDSWMFQRRPDIDGVDERFENRLICLESFNNNEDEEGNDDENAAHERGDPSAEGNWIEKFDASFQRRMVQDVETLVETRGLPSTIKIKAALGFTSFDLPHASTACRLYTWQQLQQLQLHKDLRRRWENTCNIRSETVATLMHTLKSRVPHGASYETALTVYLGSDNATIRDFSVKFLWTQGQWSPVTSRYPCREPHGLYNISLDNETAFRVRVYTREYPTNWETYAAVWDEFELIQHPSGDPLRTEVKLRDGHSTDTGMFIRRVWLREKTWVDYEGIRFSISFSNADHTDAIIQCQAVPTDDSPIQPTQELREILEKMLSVLTQ